MVYRATVCVVPYEAYKESEERCFVILLFIEGIFYFLFFSYLEIYNKNFSKDSGLVELKPGFSCGNSERGFFFSFPLQENRCD